MRHLLLTAVILATCSLLVAAPLPKPKEVGSVEIDFSPLSEDVVKKDFKVTLTLKSKSGVSYKDVITCDAGASTKMLRNMFRDSVMSTGWQTKESGDSVLLIERHKDSDLTQISIKAETLDGDVLPAPKVKRIPVK